MNQDELQLPPDITPEEVIFLELVKEHMLQKLDDRRKFIFLYCIELGRDQKAAARVLNVHETSISRHLKMIREILGEFRNVKNLA